jgi:prepilin signal peptidase PulO-like enzyme (type II secretory pathway)
MGLFLWGLGTLLKYFLKKPTLGLGDVQLWTVLSLFLKVQDFPFFILLTGFLGFCMFLIYRKKTRLPFVPAISLAFLISFWFK